ncbi:MAG: hypothetical protein WCU88_07050 [Elusimicrobiota bacterium]
MKRLVIPALAMVICGCRASVVELRKAQKGPVPEVGYIDPGGGQLRWALKGGSLLQRQRRKNALKRAALHCAGAEVKVKREWTQEDAETSYQAEDLAESVRLGLEHYRVEPYMHLEFECVR